MTSTCAHRGSLWKSAVVMKSLWAAQMITAFSVVSEISGCNPLLFLVDARFCMYRYTNLIAEYAKICWQLTWLRGLKNPHRCVDGFLGAKRGALTPIYNSTLQQVYFSGLREAWAGSKMALPKVVIYAIWSLLLPNQIWDTQVSTGAIHRGSGAPFENRTFSQLPRSHPHCLRLYKSLYGTKHLQGAFVLGCEKSNGFEL